MSTTTTACPSLVKQSNIFSTLPTKNGTLKAVTVPSGGMMTLLSHGRPAASQLRNHNIMEKCHSKDLAEEALRLSRETLMAEEMKKSNGTIIPDSPHSPSAHRTPGVRLNKFVRRLHDMLISEQESGVVEWRKGLLVLHSTDTFAKQILPKYFNTRNFKTFRRQLNYYGFVHVRSFSTTGTSTTALWVNRELAKTGSADVSSVLLLRRVEPCESAKTTEGRRVRKELAIHMVEEDLGVSAKTLQMEQIRTLALRGGDETRGQSNPTTTQVPSMIHFPASVSCSGEESTASYSGGRHRRRRHSSLSSVTSHAMMDYSSDDEASAANLLLNLSKLS